MAFKGERARSRTNARGERLREIIDTKTGRVIERRNLTTGTRHISKLAARHGRKHGENVRAGTTKRRMSRGAI